MDMRENTPYHLFSTSSFKATEYQNVSAKLHANLDMEIVIVYEGVLHMNIENVEYAIPKGNGIFILPFERHDFRSINFNTCHVIMFCEPYSTFFFKYVGVYTPKTRVFSLPTPLQNYIRYQLDNQIHDKELLKYSVIFPLFDSIALNCEFHNTKHFDHLFLDTLYYINQHLTEPLSEKQIAQNLFVHPGSLSRTFAKYAGMNIKKYITQRRLLIAYELLKQGKTVTEVTYEVGFGSIRNFNRVFRDFFHCTPSDITKHPMRPKRLLK